MLRQTNDHAVVSGYVRKRLLKRLRYAEADGIQQIRHAF
jgi:hypothetical protein